MSLKLKNKYFIYFPKYADIHFPILEYEQKHSHIDEAVSSYFRPFLFCFFKKNAEDELKILFSLGIIWIF